MVRAIGLLLCCQLLGEAIHRWTGLPLPGPVIGMFVLLGWLLARPRERRELTSVSNWLLAHLSLMFVPAAVGLMEQGRVLSRYGLLIAVATVASTLLTLVVTGTVFRLVAGSDEARP